MTFRDRVRVFTPRYCQQDPIVTRRSIKSFTPPSPTPDQSHFARGRGKEHGVIVRNQSASNLLSRTKFSYACKNEVNLREDSVELIASAINFLSSRFVN